MTTTTRVALVTGGSKGIGAATARALAQAGMNVALTYRQDRAAADRVAAEVTAMGRQVAVLQADLADPHAPAAVFAEARKRLGQVDVLVNNAAETAVIGIDHITADQWDRLLAVNLRAPFLLAQLALREMRPRRWGRIINVASQAGQAGGIFIGAHYAASKGALLTLTKSLAREGAADNVLVNAVSPGLVDTDMVAAFPPDRLAQAKASVPVGRLASPEDVAAAIRFLASDAASYITGATLPVNGGLLMI
jgi:3-oxoacyl-[acyl-carrier protein] reductase